MFKPLTSNPNSKASSGTELLSPEAQAAKQKEQDSRTELDKSRILATTEERIHIIFDDSGSMDGIVAGSGDGSTALTTTRYGLSSTDKNKITLAIEGATEYLKNCKPHVTAVQVAPLNVENIPLSKNLPATAAALKKIEATGGTPLFRKMGEMVDQHKDDKYTRALIFTDGEAGDSYTRPKIFTELREMKIPIDFIIIGNKTEAQLNTEELNMKAVVESSGGVFMICKDGKMFKERMKFFAPLLRYRLAAIASQDSRGEQN